MIDIRYLEKEDLFLIQTFILKEKKFFEKFFNLGWSYKNIKNHFHKEDHEIMYNIIANYFYGGNRLETFDQRTDHNFRYIYQ